MNAIDSLEEAAFRTEARIWLEKHAPEHVLPLGQKVDDAEEVKRGRAWQSALYEGGYGGITLPKALGGRGGTILEALVFSEEEAHYRLPKGPYIGIGLGMALPVIARHGTPEQAQKFFEPTLRGELTWCQLFSEPGAGSDLAAVRTRAVKQGSEWVVNGQKVWSSWAHQADFGILVARSDPSVPKHKGLTFFVIDMKSPGVDVRPIRQITGASDFNETFLAGARIPDEQRIGPPGEGWACCMTVLTGERLNEGSNEEGGIGALIRYARPALASDAARLALASAYADELAERRFQSRLRTMVSRGENPGARAAMIKLAAASRAQRARGLAMELRGLDAIAADPQDSATNQLWRDYLWSAAVRIAGGADEVLRNQIAERLLGMPGEIRADKDVPFEQLK